VSGLEQIAYDNAIRALDKQEKLVEDLRARTGVLLAAASLAVSLLGGRAFADDRPVPLVVAALAALVLAFAGSLLVLMPRAFVFAVAGPPVYERYYGIRDDPAEIHRRIAYQLHRFWERNEALFVPVDRAFRVAVWSLVVEILTLAALASGIF